MTNETVTDDVWESPQFQNALRMVLQYEIQSLLQRLASTGVESVVITASTVDGTASHLGSTKGKGFVKNSDIEDVKKRFLCYCKDDPASVSGGEQYVSSRSVNCVPHDSQGFDNTQSYENVVIKTEPVSMETYQEEFRQEDNDQFTRTKDRSTTGVKKKAPAHPGRKKNDASQQIGLGGKYGRQPTENMSAIHTYSEFSRIGRESTNQSRRFDGETYPMVSPIQSPGFAIERYKNIVANEEANSSDEPFGELIRANNKQGPCLTQKLKTESKRQQFKLKSMALSKEKHVTDNSELLVQDKNVNSVGGMGIVTELPDVETGTKECRASSFVAGSEFESDQSGAKNIDANALCGQSELVGISFDNNIVCKLEDDFNEPTSMNSLYQPAPKGQKRSRNRNTSHQSTIKGKEAVGSLASFDNVPYAVLNRDSVKCLVCHKIMQKQSFRQHTPTHQRGFKFSCQFCGRGFKWKFNLDTHMKIHSITRNRNFACSCRKTFLYKHHLTAHVAKCKNGRPLLPSGYERLYKCPYCTQGFRILESLYEHVEAHEKDMNAQT